MKLKTDPEFRSLIPPLSTEELSQLETNLIADGCRDPLVVWGETLVDGHNRYEICTRRSLPFQTKPIEFPTREAAMDWMDANQLGRRNLSPDQASLLRGRRYNRAKKTVGKPAGIKLAQSEPISTADKLAAQHGVSRETIKRDGQFASAVEKLSAVKPDIAAAVSRSEAPPKKEVIRAAQLLERDPEKAAAILAGEGKKVHVSMNSGENEWYTPAVFIEAARKTMGDIDLDPASCELANETVRAKRIFTKEQDGLTQQWAGRVWMNPPYAQPLMSQFAEKVASEFEAGNTTEACILVNNATDTEWFHRMMRCASSVCFTKGRVRFIDKHGNPSGAPLQGQAVIYMGKSNFEFAEAFQTIGFVLWK
jgi:hypothetical protein